MRKQPHPETCPRCPNRYSEVGCPFYLTGKEGLVEEKPTISGPPDTRLVTGCIWHEGHLMRWVSHMVAASNKPADVLQGWRNDMMEQFAQFGQRATASEVIKALGSIPSGIKTIPLPEGIEFNLPDKENATN